MTKAFVIQVQMLDEIFGPDHTLTTRRTVAVPNGTTYAAAYAELERELRGLCANLLRTELEERERRGQLVDKRRMHFDPEYNAEIRQRHAAALEADYRRGR